MQHYPNLSFSVEYVALVGNQKDAGGPVKSLYEYPWCIMVCIMCVCISVTPGSADTRWFIIIKGWTLVTAAQPHQSRLECINIQRVGKPTNEKMKWMSKNVCGIL